VTAGARAGELADAVVAGDIDPWTAADELLGDVVEGSGAAES
jgi:hypothetical protein